jgi:WXG100 family type VII secretion target
MPTEGHLLVTLGAVDGAATDTDTVANHIDQQLDHLRSYLAPLAATWTGQASGDYHSLQARWDAAAAGLNAVLREMAAALRTAHGNYAQVEATNASIWA